MANSNRPLVALATLLLAAGAFASPVVATAAVTPDASADATSSSNALVRVEVIDHDAGTRTRSSTAVAWSQTAAMNLELSGHAHALSITPHSVGSRISVDFDHSRDGVVVADDLHLGGDRRFVIDNANTTVVVTVIAIKTSVQAH